MNILWKILISTARVGAIVYLVICLALLTWQNRLIFAPSERITATPDQLGLSYEDVWLKVVTKSGKIEKIHGWWLPTAKKSDRVLLYLHGNGGNVSWNLESAKRYANLGFSVLLIDYRGYGRSEGSFPTEAKVYKDAQVAWDYLVTEQNIPPENIFIYGHSLGGAIAIDLAVRQPQVAGVIVQNTFTSIHDMVEYMGGFYRLLPINILVNHRFDSLAKVGILRSPILFIHGQEDKTVPASMSQVLYNQAQVPKEILFVPDAGHNDVAAIAGDLYLQTVEKFYELCSREQAVRL